MIIIFFGAPGSGKGTQAQTISRELGISYIATGNLLRAEIASGSELGHQVKDIMDEGRFPSDELVLKVFEEEFAKHADDSIILDGIPRTLNQAEKLDPLLAKYNKKVDLVFEFDLDDSHLISRILGRFSCKNCGAAYHKEFNKPKVHGVCDFCESTEFVVRKDDEEEVLKRRLELYYLETQPILGYYKEKQVLYKVSADLPPKEVGEQILTVIKEKSR